MRIRRAVAGVVAAALAMIALAACQNGDGRGLPVPTSTTPTVVTSGPPAVGDCPMPEIGNDAAGSVLTPGPSNGLPLSTARAEALTIEAIVLDAACAPAQGAGVTVWHTDSRGVYGPGGADECCYYQGTVSTDRNGRFRLETIRPGQYPQAGAPPAHIHLEIRHTSGGLDTEIVFTPDSRPPVSIRPSELVPVFLSTVDGATGRTWYGEAAFMLEP